MITRAHILACIGLFLLGCLVGREWRDRSADLAESRQEVKQLVEQVEAVQGARAIEQSQGQAMADIGAKHEEDREAAAAVPAAVVADLRAGNVRLRQEWAGCETRLLSEAVASTVERDAAAAVRAEAAGRIVRIGRDADDQLRACQAVIAGDRQ
ncbi:lysis system i-spanin subunit Rz [Stenotrophomonas pictorum]|uniref:lysis system i-spanin subunit Rz n=1 Tax=Stenotrophomonas pictorum TaxID=86184 RepID=UPI000A669492|nr:lysis system i-spanin subunit Rz [Stenotrophomonas pictorum]